MGEVDTMMKQWNKGQKSALTGLLEAHNSRARGQKQRVTDFLLDDGLKGVLGDDSREMGKSPSIAKGISRPKEKNYNRKIMKRKGSNLSSKLVTWHKATWTTVIG